MHVTHCQTLLLCLCLDCFLYPTKTDNFFKAGITLQWPPGTTSGPFIFDSSCFLLLFSNKQSILHHFRATTYNSFNELHTKLETTEKNIKKRHTFKSFVCILLRSILHIKRTSKMPLQPTPCKLGLPIIFTNRKKSQTWEMKLVEFRLLVAVGPYYVVVLFCGSVAFRRGGILSFTLSNPLASWKPLIL